MSSLRQAVVILGMHRGGTSAMAGILARLGLALPRTPLDDAADNPEGFYESKRVVERNFDILTAERCFWNVCFTLEPAALQAVTRPETYEELYNILHEEFGDAGSFVLKEPRLCLLLPLWFPGLTRLAPSQHVLLMLRHPAEVARSHFTRNGLGEEEVLINWLHHMLQAEKMTRQLPRAAISYPDLLNDWQAALTPALGAAGIVPPRSLAEAGPAIDRFIDAGLRHHQVTEAGARLGPAYLAPLVDTSWRALTALTHNPQDGYALAALDDARENFFLLRQELTFTVHGPMLQQMRRAI